MTLAAVHIYSAGVTAKTEAREPIGYGLNAGQVALELRQFPDGQRRHLALRVLLREFGLQLDGQLVDDFATAIVEVVQRSGGSGGVEKSIHFQSDYILVGLYAPPHSFLHSATKRAFSSIHSILLYRVQFSMIHATQQACEDPYYKITVLSVFQFAEGLFRCDSPRKEQGRTGTSPRRNVPNCDVRKISFLW